MQLFKTLREILQGAVPIPREVMGRGTVHHLEERHIANSSLPVTNSQIVFLLNKVQQDYSAEFGGCTGTIPAKYVFLCLCQIIQMVSS